MAMAVAGLTVAATVMIVAARRLIRDEPAVKNVVVAALALRLAGPLIFRRVANDLYEGSADAVAYGRLARGVAENLSQGIIRLGPDQLGGFELLGTGTIIVATAVMFVVFGANDLVAFFIFAAAAFVGQCLLYRAFTAACPEADRRWYARLVFLTPSVIFWTSAASKEAWMLLFLGVTAYGLARSLGGHRRGHLSILLGVLGLVVVRPHVAAIATAALLLSHLRPRAAGRRRTGPLRFAIGAALGIGMLVGSTAITQDFLGLDDVSTGSVDDVLERTSTRLTDLGDSSFEPPKVKTPVDIPFATMTVLFRPFPTEAHNAQMQFAAIESLAILAFALFSAGRLTRLPREAWRNPYVLFSLAFVLGYIFAFSYLGNFGLLARQRIQVLPFLFVLLTAPLGTSPRGASVAAVGRRP